MCSFFYSWVASILLPLCCFAIGELYFCDVTDASLSLGWQIEMLQGRVWAQFVLSDLSLGLISICYHADLSEMLFPPNCRNAW